MRPGLLWVSLGAMLLPACSKGSEALAAKGQAVTAPSQPKPAGNGKVTGRAGGGHYDLGDYVVYGEVFNGTDQPIYAAELALTFQDASGKTIANGDAATGLLRIEPGKSAPLIKTHYGAPEGIVSAKLEVTRWDKQGPQRPVTILESRTTGGQLGAIVSGKGRNDTGGPLSGIKLVTSFRDAEGKVIGVFFSYPVNGTLGPGQTFDFMVETFDSSVTSAKALVQGEGSGP